MPDFDAIFRWIASALKAQRAIGHGVLIIPPRWFIRAQPPTMN